MSFFKNEKGAITIFQCLILIALLLFTGILTDAARIAVAQRKLQSAVNTSVRSVLADYDISLIGDYGVFGLDSYSENSEVKNNFEKYLNVNLNSANYGMKFIDYRIEETNIEGFGNLLNNDVLERQILEHMKYRAPLALTENVISKIKSSGLFEKLQFSKKEKVVRKKRKELKGKIGETNEVLKEISEYEGDNDIEDLKNIKEKLNDAKSKNNSILEPLSEYIEAKAESDSYAAQYNSTADDESKIEITTNSEFDNLEEQVNVLDSQIDSNIVKVEETIEKLEELESKLIQLVNERNDLVTERDNIAAEVEEINVQISDLNRYIEEIDREISELNNMTDEEDKENNKASNDSEKSEESGDTKGSEGSQSSDDVDNSKSTENNGTESKDDKKDGMSEEEKAAKIVELLIAKQIAEEEINDLTSLADEKQMKIDDLNIKIDDLNIKIGNIQSEIEKIKSEFKLEDMNEIEIKEPPVNESERPSKDTGKDEMNDFLDSIKEKLGSYLKNINEEWLISDEDLELISEIDSDFFDDMSKVKTEMDSSLYDSMNSKTTEYSEDESETENDNILNFLDILFNALESGRNKIYINEYIMDNFTYLTSKTTRDHYFEKGEVEYIIWGDNNQLSNISKTMGSIWFMRFAINTIDYYAKSANPEPQTRLIFALGKALIRSCVDMQKLYKGQNIELCPSVKSLKLNYADHLRLFLLIQSLPNQDGQLNNIKQLYQVNIKQHVPDFELKNYNTVIHGTAKVSINLWFLPMLLLDKLDSEHFKDGRYVIKKEIFQSY